jgi:hypothetical protein
MSYGDATTTRAHRWALDEDAAQPFFRQAVEAGITFWDTANTYQLGTSEELVGRAIRRYSRREDIVLSTKVFGKMHDGPGGQGLSRKAILEQADASLTRLGTDYIDLLPDPPLRPGHLRRGDHGGPARYRQGRQGPLPGRVLHVRLAVREAAVHSRPPRLDPVRGHAEPVQPAPTPGGARTAAHVCEDRILVQLPALLLLVTRAEPLAPRRRRTRRGTDARPDHHPDSTLTKGREPR